MLKSFLSAPLDLLRLRGLILAMTWREFRSRYAGTLGGVVWAVVQPLATVAVFWFVFSVGFKAQGPDGQPFVLYFLCGYVPWLFFAESVQTSANVVVGNAHLVKKTLFPTQILPVVQVATACISHAVLIAVLLAALLVRGGSVTLVPQFAYYLGAAGCLGLGLAWLAASLQVFHRDTAQVLGVAINLWFWLTPIVWTVDMAPAEYRWVIDWNPMAYVVQGYRETFLEARPFWADPVAAVRFWIVAGSVLVIGAFAFRKLKPDFPDVL